MTLVDFCPTDRRPRLSSYSWLAIRHIFFNSIIIIMVVNAGIYCPFRICLLHGSAVQRAAVRRTLIKEFYGSLLVLLEHFCLYDLVLDFFYKNY